MNLELKITKSYKSSMLYFALFGMLAAIMATFVSSIFLYVAAALLAVFFIFDKSGNKFHSILLLLSSVLISVIYNVLTVFLFSEFLYYNLYAAEAAVLALIISLMFLKKRSKAETVVVLCSAVTVFILADIYLMLVGDSGTFSFAVNKELFLNTVNELRVQFIKSITDISIDSSGFSQAIFTEEAAAEIFDSIKITWAGLLFIPVFLGAGILCKIFSYFTFIMLPDDDGGRVIGWHFETTTIIAYFYCVLFILSAFVSVDTVLGIAIANLNMIFTVVYSYIGISFVIAMLSVKRKKTFSWLLIIAALFMLSSLAVRILSLLGVFCTIVGNKARGGGFKDSSGGNPFDGANGK